MPSGRCKVPYLPGVWAVMVSNWSRVRGHAPILRPHRVRHRSEPVRRRSARRFLDSLSRRAASIPDSRPVRWSSPSALTAGCGTSAASKSPQSSANSRIQFGTIRPCPEPSPCGHELQWFGLGGPAKNPSFIECPFVMLSLVSELIAATYWPPAQATLRKRRITEPDEVREPPVHAAYSLAS